MKCYCTQTEDAFYYVVDDAPEYSYNLIEKAFYIRHGDSFKKWYPVDMPDKEIVVPNYERLAPNIYLRNKANWEEALDKFCYIAKKHSIDFILRGSVVACINGININPTDIDVNIDVSSFEKMHIAFKYNVIEPFVYNDSLMMVRYFGRICLGNMWIDTSAFPKKGYEITDIHVTIWNGHIIKTQSLTSCLQIYQQIGKLDYVQAIEAFLKMNSE